MKDHAEGIFGAIVAVLALAGILLDQSCTGSAQPPILDGAELKRTALMAARVVANETAIALQCVPGERREGCVNDLGMIVQRTRAMAERHNRTLYDELRRHSPRATGRCMQLAEDGVPRGEWPRRCHMRPTGNVRWSPGLRMDGREPMAWRDVVGLPWSAREARWIRVLQDAVRVLRAQWSPCEVDPETWGGVGDVPGPGLYRVACGPMRNTAYARRAPGSRVLSAELARGDR